MPTTVAACQIAVDDLDVESNLATVERRVTGLPDGVAVAVFPECALTGFAPDRRAVDAALRRDGPALDRIAAVAGETETAIVAGFLERGGGDGGDVDCGGDADGDPDGDGDDLYNAAAYVAPDGTRTVYRKRHLRGGEREVLEAGDELVTVETPVGRAGILTCYDLNFVADSAALTRARVDALLVPGAWPAAYSENWTLLVRARALDGVRWAVGAGRTGRRDLPDAPAVVYAGRSLVARPDGGVHAALDRREDDLVAELDAETLEAQRDLVGIYDE